MEKGQNSPVLDTHSNSSHPAPSSNTEKSPAPDLANQSPAPQSHHPSTSPTRKHSKFSLIALIILAILAVALIAVIIFFILKGTGVIKKPVDLTDVTTTSLNEEIANYENLTYDEQAAMSTELGDKVIAYAEQVKSEKGDYNIDTIRANLSVADYYYANDFDEGVEYLQNQLDAISKISNPSNDIIEAKILYGTELFTAYLDTGQTDSASSTYSEILESIPDDTPMHENNWPAIRETISERLNEKLKEQ